MLTKVSLDTPYNSLTSATTVEYQFWTKDFEADITMLFLKVRKSPNILPCLPVKKFPIIAQAAKKWLNQKNEITLLCSLLFRFGPLIEVREFGPSFFREIEHKKKCSEIS